MGFIRALCPNCGANLSVSAEAVAATCTYCDTTSRLQRRTRVFQIPIPAPGPPGPVAVQRVSRAAIIIPVVMVVGLLAFSGYMMQRSMMRSAASRSAVTPSTGPAVPKPKPEPEPTWYGGAAIGADVDRDGTQDLIGVVRAKAEAHLVALSGVDGKRLWMAERVATFADLHPTRVALAGTTLLWVDHRDGLHAFELATGARRWQVALGEPAKLLCEGSDPAQVTIMTTDKRWHAVALADGLRTDASPLAQPDERTWGKPAALPPCALLPSSGATRIDGAVVDHDRLSTDGMWIGYKLVADDRRIAVGHRMPGTYVPMVAQIDEAKRLVWKLDVPAGDAFAASTGAPALAALTGALLVVVYGQNNASPMVTAIDAATGMRRWSAEVPGGRIGLDRLGLTLTPEAVVVSRTGILQVLDHTGRVKFTIGALE